MRFRKLRIAWSVGWGLLALLLSVFWVRSYWWMDNIQAKPMALRTFQCTSQEGRLHFDFGSGEREWLSIIMHIPNSDSDFRKWRLPPAPFHFEFYDDYPAKCFRVRFPYWAPIFLIAVLSALPWLAWRFSLRTLLIAITLVAVVLGLIEWLR